MERLFQVSSPERLDIAIAVALDMSRTLAKELVNQGLVSINDKPAQKASTRLKGHETIRVKLPPPKPNTVKPENIQLDILYEDEDLIAINKPPNLIAHPTAHIRNNTVVNALLGKTLLSRNTTLSPTDEAYRPGIVHRLDKDTSGIMVVAKHDKAHQSLADAFKHRQTQKEYLAIVVGRLENEINLNGPIGRHPVQRQKMTVGGENPREASTHFSALSHTAGHTLVRAKPHTGRTHQIRVHLAYLGHSILADEVYGSASKFIARQALHAYTLKLPHPSTGKMLSLLAPVPPDIIEAWLKLGGQWPNNLEV